MMFEPRPGRKAKVLEAAVLAFLLTAILPTSPAGAADYYAGKRIDLVVGANTGGGIDLYARTLAHHLGRHIPGSPAIVVRNMPGAGGAKAGYHISSIAPKDGLSIAALFNSAIVAPLLDDKTDTSFDPARVAYLGSANAGVGICVTLDHAKTTTFEQALKQTTLIGGAARGNPIQDLAFLVKRTTGAQFDVIVGYRGAVDVALAMERRELDGICWVWSSVKSSKPDWIKGRRLNFLVQVGLEEHRELTAMGIPPIWRYTTSDENRKVAQVVLAQQSFERPYIVAEGTPADLVSTLRAAFDATMTDPQFLAEAEKVSIDIAPLAGAKVQDLVRTLYGTPRDIIERARAAIRP